LVLGLLSLTAHFPNGLPTDVSATHARRKLQFEQILDPKSVALRVEKALGLLSLPCTAFSLTTFSLADEMFVSEHLTAMTEEHPKDLVVVFADTASLEIFGVCLDHYKQHDNSRRILCICVVSETAYNKAGQVLSSPRTQDKLGNVGETLLVNLHPGKDTKNLHKLLWY
jgi:hypothetical protein